MTVRQVSIKGEQLRFLAHADSSEKLITGTATGDTGEAGIFKVKGTYIYWIDDDGNERRVQGTTTGSTGTAGVIKVKGDRVYYIDDDGDERYAGTIWAIDILNNGYPYLIDNAPAS